MKQVLQSLKTGDTIIAHVPTPAIKRGHLLISTKKTLVSAGTERMLVEFGKANFLDKARQQPDKVRMVIEKIKTDGLQPTIEAVFNKLDQPLPLGYCNVGCVAAIGKDVTGFELGDRVVSNGKHAEAVSVPINLCAKIPDNISDDEAAFTILGAIALQGIRLVNPTLGETVVVTGLGLIGLMTVQLLRAHGCRVLGIDFDREKLKLAKQFGAEIVDLAADQDPIKVAQNYSRERGVDAVIITAATKSSEPMHQAAQMCRKRGRIVLVGVAGLELSRDDFFKKELTFQVSASYGPGRYDPNYEEKGQDYPVGFVRWTEQRNFEAVLDMMSEGKLDVRPLLTHRFAIDDAQIAYELVASNAPSLGILLEYPGIHISDNSRTVHFSPLSELNDQRNFRQDELAPVISFVGAGNYASGVLMPAFKEAGAYMRSVASTTGVSGLHAAQKFGFDETTTDTDRLFSDPDTAGIVITTQHDSHSRFVLQALATGKHVFVEKPLCITLDELQQIESAYNQIVSSDAQPPILMVGFNRRFAPHIQKMKLLLRGVSGPKNFIMTVNAGAVPTDHWTQDTDAGGGRILGEACHFVDLLRFMADCPIKSWTKEAMDSITNDTVAISLKFVDGSIGTIHYVANGNRGFPKERLEVFAGGRVLQLDNYRKLKGFGWPGFSRMNLWRQDKGNKACARAFVEAVSRTGLSPIPFSEVFEVSRISIALSR